MTADAMILCGARSPLVVDYEETLARLGAAYRILSVSGPPRAFRRDLIVAEADVRAAPGPFVAVAFRPERRQALAELAEALGLAPAPALVDPAASLPISGRVGPGSYINSGVCVGGATRIGRHVIVNRASSIGHHCQVEDFASIGPGVHIASNCRVGERCIIGLGASILPDVQLGAGAIVAGGSLVREDVPDGAFVAGSPARPRDYNRQSGVFGPSDQE